MIDMDKRTGTKPYFEPMRNELEDCFTAILDVSGSTTYGSGSGISQPTEQTNPSGGEGDGIMVKDLENDISN